MSLKKQVSGFLILIVVLSLLPAGQVSAMCPEIFVPPQREMTPDDNTHGLLLFDKETTTETLILEPSFHGNAKDFGMILPLPSRPEITEAPETIFLELEDLTNPARFIGDEDLAQAPSAGGIDGIDIIEQKDVGDYKVTVLTADTSQALIDWLLENEYEFDILARDNFDYYVEKGGFFFVAMKVNMEKARVDAQGFLRGKLRPIEFVFSSEEPMLPLRIMSSTMPQMSFTIYALSDRPYYVPGTQVVYSKKVTVDSLFVAPSLQQYNAEGKWLTRSTVEFDPIEIQEDLVLERGTEDLTVASFGERKIVNPHLLSKESGIMPTTDGQFIYLPPERSRERPEETYVYVLQQDPAPSTSLSTIMVLLTILIGVQLAVLFRQKIEPR